MDDFFAPTANAREHAMPATLKRRQPRLARKPIARTLAIALALACASPPILASAEDHRQRYTLPQQPLAKSLNQLATASDRQILFDPGLIRNETAPAVSGEYSFEQALGHLLASSKLTYNVTPAGVVTVVQAQAAQPPRPNPVPPQSAAPQAPAQPAELSSVQVVGSRIKRSEIEGPSPVTVISAEQMEIEGAATVFEALENMVIATGSVETELSGGFSANAHPLNLRGMGPGRSLLLINGRRAADYPFPYGGRSNFQNFGNIPSGAVERVEVLAGGASAIYGADAVAGVVNVVLKSNLEGDSVTLRTGTTTMGGGDRIDLQWAGGRTGDQWGLTYALQFFDQEPLYGWQRDFWTRSANPNPSFLGEVPSLTRGVRIRRTGGSQPRNYTPPPGACEAWGGDLVRWNEQSYSATTGIVTERGQQCANWIDDGLVHLRKGKREYAAYLYGTWDFTSDLQGWASLQSLWSNAESLGGFESITGPHTDGVGRRGNFFDPVLNTQIETHRGMTPFELGSREAMNQHYFERSIDLAVGLRGRLGDRFDWDATLSRAEYDFVRERRRFVGALVSDWFFGPQLGTTSGGIPIHQLNQERWWRPLTADEYSALSTIARYDASSWVSTGSVVLSGDLFELPAGPVGMAAVLEASRQGYDLDSDPRALPDRVELYNLTTTNGGGKRSRYAAGIEFRVPITTTLNASLATRYDYYDDITAVGGASTYNFGLEWRPTSNLLLRGAYATSFKAPDMHWIFAEGAGSFSTTQDIQRCIVDGFGTAQTQITCPTSSPHSYSMFSTTAGNPDLEEETGKSWSAGLVWDIIDNLSLTMDYWNIRLENAIELPSAATILQDEAGCRTGLTPDRQSFQSSPDSAYCQAITALVTREPDPEHAVGRIRRLHRAAINQAYREVNGIDAALTYRLDTGNLGRYRFNVSWSHTLESKRQMFAGDDIENNWRDDHRNLDYRSRARASVDWRQRDWTAAVSMTRFGSLPKYSAAGNRERTRVLHRWNANIGKQITNELEMKFYVNNIFNRLHPHDETNSSFPYFYDAFSPVGREVMAQVRFNFR